MRLMILENRGLRNTLRAESGLVSIGSSRQCNVYLPDPRISAHQVSLRQDADGTWWLEVVNSSVPTCLNRAVQKGKARLRHADEIEMGAFAIRLFMESDKTREQLQRERMLALTKKHGESLPLDTVVHKQDSEMAVSREHLEQMTLLAIRLEQMENVRDLLMPILRALLRTFNARRAWVGIRKRDRGDFDWTLGLAQNGKSCERPPFSRRMQDRCLSNSQHLCVPNVPVDGVRSAMAVPLACQTGNLGMLYVDNNPEDQPYSKETLNMLSAVACCVAMPLETVLRRSTAKRRAVASTEQTIARATQDAVTPKALPQWDQLQVAAYRYMGSTNCRDFYDIVQLPDKTASIIVARLSAQSTAMPRLFAEVRTAFRIAALHLEEPHLFARALNWLVYNEANPCAVDLVNAWIFPKTGRVKFFSAGTDVHLGRIQSDGTCDRVGPSGIGSIGRTRDQAFTAQAMELPFGDTLLLATSGVETATNADGQVFGLSGLEESLCDGLSGAPGHVLSEFATDLTEFITGGDCRDDQTVVLVRRGE